MNNNKTTKRKTTGHTWIDREVKRTYIVDICVRKREKEERRKRMNKRE
jgi:hypothetical protein